MSKFSIGLLILLSALKSFAGNEEFQQGKEWGGNCSNPPQPRAIAMALEQAAHAVVSLGDEMPTYVLDTDWKVESFMSICRLRVQDLSANDWKKVVLKYSPAKTVTRLDSIKNPEDLEDYLRKENIVLPRSGAFKHAVGKFLNNIAIKDPGHDADYPAIKISHARIFVGSSKTEVLLALVSIDRNNSSQDFSPIVFTKVSR